MSPTLITVKLDDRRAYVDSRLIDMGVPASDSEGMVLAPLSPILRPEGYSVSWSEKSKRMVAVKLQFGWPLEDRAARITSPYGYRQSPFDPSVREFHSGVDLAAPEGANVLAAADGVVSYLGWDPDGFGRYILIAHGPDVVTRYAHLSETKVKEGDKVKAGQVIGCVGRSGRATGFHLDWGVYCMDPNTPFLVDQGSAKLLNRAAAVDPILLLLRETPVPAGGQQ